MTGDHKKMFPRWSTHWLATPCLLLLAAGAAEAADNLLFNSGFDLDSCGYTVVKFLNPGRNPQLKYIGASVTPHSPRPKGWSLTIPNPHAEHVRVFAREFNLAPDTGYTLSFNAMSEHPRRNVQVVIQAFEGGSWAPLEYYSESFQIGDHWTPCVFKFKTPPVPAGSAPRTFSLTFDFPPDAKDTLHLDGLRLASGPVETYSPAPGLELACRFPEHVLVTDGGGVQATYELFVVNHDKNQLKGELSLTLANDFSGNLPNDVFDARREVLKQVVSLAPGERKTITGKIPLNAWGSFALLPAFNGAGKLPVASFPGRCAVIAPSSPRLINLDTDYGVGLNFAGAGFLSGGDDFLSGYFNATDYEQLYAAMGARLLRDWDCTAPVFGLYNLEPEQEGRFNFTRADRVVDAARRCGMTVLPILGGTEFTARSDGQPQWPNWLKNRCPSINQKIYLPPLDVWRNYVKAVASHFKGRVTHYEIMNESNLYMAAKHYVPYLKAAYETIKAVDPTLKVVGVCTTGDMGSGLSNFLDDCAKEGAMKYCDIVSFHPYNAPNLGWDELPADKLIEKLRERMNRYGCPQKPLWNTELYYLTGNGHGMDKEATQPQDLAQRFLLDLGEGLGQSTSICASSLFRNVCTPHSFSSPYFWNFAYPVNFPVYNALARFFQNARPVAKIRWDAASICYVYERQGKPSAACWRYGKSEVRLNVTEAMRRTFVFHDLYGNVIQPGTSLELTAKPYYLTAASDDLSTAAAVAMLKSAATETPSPVVVKTATAVAIPGGLQLSLTLYNRMATGTLTGVITVADPQFRDLAMDLFSLPAGKSAVCNFVKTARPEPAVPHRVILNLQLEDGQSWKMEVPLDFSGSPAHPAPADDAVLRDDFLLANALDGWTAAGQAEFVKATSTSPACIKIESPDADRSVLIKKEIKVEKMRGKRVVIACRIKGDGLSEPVANWLGPKVMFIYRHEGTRAYYDLPKQFGTFDWKTKMFFVDVPRGADEAQLVIGLQSGAGTLYLRNLIIKTVAQ